MAFTAFALEVRSDFLQHPAAAWGVCCGLTVPLPSALEVRDLASRLIIVVPSAVALTALQVLVVATDVQARASHAASP
jgi:hypothetical protein